MRGGYFFLLMIIGAAMFIGCGGGNIAHLDVAAGQLAVSPSTLNFGKVAVGQSVTKTGTLKAGNSHITVTSADWSGEGYSISGIVFPVTIAAGQSVPFKVTFAPQKSGGSTGHISFLSDALNSPHAELLTASGNQPSGHSVTLSWLAETAKRPATTFTARPLRKGRFRRLTPTQSDGHLHRRLGAGRAELLLRDDGLKSAWQRE